MLFSLFSIFLFFFFLMIPPPPRSTLFPYTTLFRSRIFSIVLMCYSVPASSVAQQVVQRGFRASPRVHPFHDHRDRKSTRLNSSHTVISYAVFCLKKKKKKTRKNNKHTKLKNHISHV